MSRVLKFFVEGIPAPGGSKRFIGMSKKTGRALLIDAGGKKNKDWRKLVEAEGKLAMFKQGWNPFEEPLEISVTFFMPRPKSQFDSRGNLKPSSPSFHIFRPDTTKLLRSTEDALTGIVWKDDAQIIIQLVNKMYGPRPGASIEVKTV